MQKDLSVAEFETIVTTRVLSRLLNNETTKCVDETVHKTELAEKFAKATHGTLRDFGFSASFKAISPRGKVFIVYRPTGRIACEVGIDGIYQGNYIRKPRAVLLSKRGYCRATTMKGLELWMAKLGENLKGGYYGRDSQSQVQRRRQDYRHDL